VFTVVYRCVQCSRCGQVCTGVYGVNRSVTGVYSVHRCVQVVYILHRCEPDFNYTDVYNMIVQNIYRTFSLLVKSV